MDTNVDQILEAFANSQPAAPAIHVPGRTTLTFADLGQQIRFVRAHLRAWGIAPGDVIAAAVPTRPEMAVACATIPASAAFVPLGPGLTAEGYSELLVRLRPKAVIVPDDRLHPMCLAAKRCGVAEITLAGDVSRPAGMFSLDLIRRDASLRLAPTIGTDVAHITCTSGTTGRAKLVPITHQRSVSFARAIGDWSELGAHDVGCHLVPLHHGHGVNSALMTPLLRGSSIVCLPEFDIEAFFDAIDTYRPTWLTAVFTIYKEMLQRVGEYRDVVARSRFRFFKLGSGALDSSEIAQLERLFRAPVLSALIAQEVLLVAHNPLPPRVRKHASVGLPVCNDVAILGDAGAWCRTGDIGEIVVRGPTVFEGYVDDAQATAEAFVDGWCRTGDLGHFDDDGYLFLAGRVKDLIHRGGEKFAPAQIDLAIQALPGIRAAAAFGMPHPTLGEEVAAAVVKDVGATIDEAQIIEHVRQRLGPKGAPRAVYFVDDLPRTDTGKIRRSELSRLLGLDRVAVSAPVDAAPRPAAASSLLETALTSLWSTVLQLKSVGANDDFFLLGGDSLRGARLLVRVNAMFDVDLSLDQLLDEAATIAGMARAIEAVRSGTVDRDRETGEPGGARISVRIPRRQERGADILSDTQRRMWFLARLDPNSVAYNESRAHRLTGDLDLGAFERSVHYLVERHDILRTTYALVDDEPRQFVKDDAIVDVETVDLSAKAAKEQDQALQHVLLARAMKPFNHQAGPLLRCVLVRLSEREHVFLRVWHHIVSDGWSNGVFNRELSAAYAAFLERREPALLPLPLQYADYAAWQRGRLQGEMFAGQLAYWKSRLTGVAALELPTDRTRPTVASHRGSHFTSELSAPLAQSLIELSRREGATLFMTLVAAYQVLLYRYSGQEDIAVGTPAAGRAQPDLEGLIGFFANTLVLRSNLSGNPSFLELLTRVRDTALGAYAHQDVPFERIVEALAPARDLSRNPLFQVSFTLQNVPGASLALDGVVAVHLPLQDQTAKFDLTLSVHESAEGLRASWNYASDLFEHDTIVRMAGHFQVLLEAIVADPEQRIGELPLLTNAERHRLLVTWNDTATDYPRDRCIHQLFEAQAASTPEAVAVVCEGRQLTYAELDARANQLAHHLRRLAVGPEKLVGLCLERSLEMMVGLMGILKAGGAYLPLDPSHPSARLEFMLADAHASVLLTQEALVGRLPQFEGCLLCLDRDWPSIAVQPTTEVSCPVTADSLAYVMYTSGSTGTPKGVCIVHRGLVNYVTWAVGAYAVASGAAVPVHSSLAFDLTVTSLFAPLVAGRTVCLVPQDQDVRTLVSTLIHAGIDYSLLKVTPAHLEVLGQHTPVERASQLARVLVVGGEQLNGETVSFWRQHTPATVIVNEYGPTETVVGCCVYTVTADSPARGPMPIGRPIANTRLYVLDRHNQPVPVGVAGEIHIGGDGVGRGYLNRPTLTAEKFLRDPFCTEPDARMYRTGDRGRYLPDGNIEFIDRFDDQVKIRGFRIELGEIEAVLAEHPAVRQAVVAAREDTPGDRRLVAYVVGVEPSEADIEALRGFVRERLPEYMRPTTYVRLECLPLSSNGKIDRRALPAPQFGRDDAGGAFVPPRDALETVIAEVWCEVLRIERVGVHDNFFDVGGHSLLATQVVARLSRLMHVEWPLRRMFEAPTIAEMAADAASRGAVSDESPFGRILRDVEALTDEETA